MVEVNRMPEEVAWQTIETAPRSGAKFWGKVGDDAIAMFWHPKFNAFISSYRRMELAKGYQFADTGETYSDHSPVIHKPTHWMIAIHDVPK